MSARTCRNCGCAIVRCMDSSELECAYRGYRHEATGSHHCTTLPDGPVAEPEE